MANSYVEYSSGLTETSYSIPFKYIAIADVLVKGFDGSAWSVLTVASRDASAKTVTLDAAPSAYQKIRVYRSTSSEQLVDFQNGSRLSERDLDTAYQQGLFVAQEVSENASTEVEGVGQQGPQGIQGPAGVSVISESFESDELNYTDAAQSVEVAHGLSSIPKIFQVVAICKTTDGGYAVNDELDFSAPKYVNSTHIGLVTFGALSFPNKSNSAVFNPNAASWKFIFRAFA
jgi:hypothetical protein